MNLYLENSAREPGYTDLQPLPVVKEWWTISIMKRNQFEMSKNYFIININWLNN